MKIIIVIITFTLGLVIGQSDVAYIRYFKDDRDFISNLSMMSTDRRGLQHLAVSYDEKNRPVKIERYASNGSLKKREMLKYNQDGKLIERGEYDDQGNYQRLIVIGKEEPWSKEFRKWQYPVMEPLAFDDQRTYFTMDDGSHVSSIVFETIDGQKYGQIELDYDYLGSLFEERWRDLPSGKMVRRFKYQFDILAEIVQIWEYGHDGDLISHVALAKAPADELYLFPPPRTGNQLDEVDIITKEIRQKRSIASYGGIIPKTIWDELILNNGDRLMIDFVNMNENGIRFRLKGEGELLTIPITRVKTLTTRLGDVIYPRKSRGNIY